MTAFDTLSAIYRNLHRVNEVRASDLAQLRLMADGIDAKRAGQAGDHWSLEAAVAQIGAMAKGTTSVATLTYGFLTGKGVTPRGLDHLVSPTGDNPNNLNSQYYQNFSLENRYINFAVNLAKNGEAKAAFETAYGHLSAIQVIGFVYPQIFGNMKEPSQITGLLNELVSNGRGGTYTRLEYFNELTGGYSNETATKAAIIGWLLAEAAKSGQGPYAQANAAYLRDLADGDIDAGEGPLFADYLPGAKRGAGGIDDSGLPGESHRILRDWDIDIAKPNPESSVRALATDGDDIIRSTPGVDGGLDAGHRIFTGGGNDLIDISNGAMQGEIDSGVGNDSIWLRELDGKVTTGDGYDLIDISQFAPLARNALTGDPYARAVVTDFKAGFDRLEFVPAAGGGVKIDVATAPTPAATFAMALAYVSSQTAANSNAVFEWDGSTYIYHQNSIAGVDDGDGLIQLAGAKSLTIGNGSTDGDINFG